MKAEVGALSTLQ